MNAPKTITSFPHKIRVIENTFITLGDGCKLAARIWLPEDADNNPVPVVFEYLPYRKRDGTAVRDELCYPYYAGHGIAGVRVDIRGNGESEGLMLDEYLQSELEDGVEVINWIAEQPWCNGNVGMMGISWGGFNGLQVAALQPAALKAIITICSTDDRYADDIHYKGGAMLMENLGWSSTMFAFSSRPPDPELVGEQWHDMWINRLENTPLLVHNWLQHPHRDAFWKHGSVCEGFSKIKIPVYAIGGWGDAYSNAVPRLVQGLESPVRGLIGPWIHKYPHFATPSPAIGFLQDSLKWWNHWLGGSDQSTDVMEKPVYQVYMMDSILPASSYPSRPGRWIAEDQWPSKNVEVKTRYLNPYGLGVDAAEAKELIVCSPQDTGIACGEYCAMWKGPEGPSDQRYDDAGSLAFDSEVLDAPVEIFGAPVVELEISVDRPQANIAVRLCDVWPGGASTRISFGILNLCHQNGHDKPMELVPGKKYKVRIQLDDIAYRVKPGNKIRVAVSNAYWPMIWPSPESVSASITSGSSKLELPVRQTVEDNPQEFEAPESAPPLQLKSIRPSQNSREVKHDIGSGETVMILDDDYGEDQILEHGLISGLHAREQHRIVNNDPLSCVSHTHWTATVRRDNWSTRTETRTTLKCDRENFYLQATIEAFENEERVYEKSWEETIKRNLL